MLCVSMVSIGDLNVQAAAAWESRSSLGKEGEDLAQSLGTWWFQLLSVGKVSVLFADCSERLVLVWFLDVPSYNIHRTVNYI